MSALFDKNAPVVMANLMRDFGLSSVQAAGLLGNIGRECGGFAMMVEVGGGSGRGMCQWSGPRAHEFETWCRRLGKPITDLEANYSFLKHELETTQVASIKVVKRARTVEGATKAFMDVFERPGVPALADRVRWARQALAAYEKQHTTAASHPIKKRGHHA